MFAEEFSKNLYLTFEFIMCFIPFYFTSYFLYSREECSDEVAESGFWLSAEYFGE